MWMCFSLDHQHLSASLTLVIVLLTAHLIRRSRSDIKTLQSIFDHSNTFLASFFFLNEEQEEEEIKWKQEERQQDDKPNKTCGQDVDGEYGQA